MVKRLIFIRHPETEENLLAMQQLHHTANFTENGRNQLNSMKEYLNKYMVNFCFSSDSPRCIKTAQELLKNKNNYNLLITPLLRDKSNGLFEGLKNSEVDWTEINKQPFETRKAPGGDSLRDVKERLLALMIKINSLPEDSIILIISHNLPLRILIGYLIGYDLKKTISEIRIKNCTFSMGELNKGEFNLNIFNQEV